MVTTQVQQIIRSARMDGPGVPEQCWEQLDAYRQELIAQAQAILNSREDAEDVVQETFCEAARHPEQMRQVESVAAWLKSINRANALDRLRNRQRDSKRIQTRFDQAGDKTFTTGGFSRVELRDTLQSAMRMLPDQLREVVRLRYFEHLSYKQIAERLKLPIGTVSGLVMDASVGLFAQLRESLPEENQPLTEADTQDHSPVADKTGKKNEAPS